MRTPPAPLALCFLGLTGFALVTIACSSDRRGDAAQGGATFALQIGGGLALDTASYVIRGPSGFVKEGAIDVRHSATLSATAGGLPAGTGYGVSIAAAAAGVSCAGGATFSVTAGATSSVVVRVTCQEAARTGSVRIDGALNVCPRIDELTTNATEAQVGAAIALSSAAHDLDGGPRPIERAWTASAGLVSGAGAAATFTCTAPGPAVVTLAVSDGDCADTLSVPLVCAPAPVQIVHAAVETDPVAHAGDAADDPAIWVDPVDPARSTIIGTDKTSGGGLAVYDLGGRQIQVVTAGALNNVDLRDGFPLGGVPVSLVTAGNRTNDSIAIYRVDPATRQLVDVAARTITTLATYGSCMYRSRLTGRTYYFVDSKAGDIEQWQLFDDGTGRVDATKVRNLPKLSSQPEACVADDELGVLYVGEEDVDIWKYGAEPDAAAPPVLVDATGPGGHLVADVEGLAIARTGAGTGYLLAASQGNSTYALYAREGANAFVKTFAVGAGCADEVTGSDGIEVTTAALGPAFPAGVFVTQDDTNGPSGNQNFKLVPWQDIVGSGGGGTCAGTPADAGAPAAADTAPAPAGDAAAGFPPDFCAAFCGKCAACWAPAAGFSEGDCLYQLAKPNFSQDDCLAGCAAGRTPAFSPGALPAGWNALTCSAFDAAI